MTIRTTITLITGRPARVGVVLFGAALLGAFGACREESPNAEDVIQTIIEDALGEIEAWSAHIEMKLTMGPRTLSLDGDTAGKGNLLNSKLWLGDGNQEMMLEIVRDADGIIWKEQRMGTRTQALKIDPRKMVELFKEHPELPYSPNSFEAGGDVLALLKNTLKGLDLELESLETENGVTLYTMSGKRKENGTFSFDFLGQMMDVSDRMVGLNLTVGSDGFPRRFELLAEDEEPFLSITITQINTKAKLDDKRFIYTPTEGIEAVDFALLIATQLEQAQHQTQQSAKFKPGDTPPPFEGTDLDGKAVKLEDYKGKVVLLDYWATWCGPCIQELPNVIDVYKKYHSKGLEIVAISLDNSEEDLRQFLTERPDMTWVQLFDGKDWQSAICQKYGVDAIPFTMLLKRDGTVHQINLRGPSLGEAIEALLAETA